MLRSLAKFCTLLRVKNIFLKTFLLLLFLSPVYAFAKKSKTDTISIRNINSGVDLEKFWKYNTGDNKEWLNPQYDDTNWKLVYADSSEEDSLLEHFEGVAWFRTTFYIDSSVSGIPLAIQMRTNGACDVFIDGRLIRSLGVVGKTEKEQVSGFSLRANIIPIASSTTGRHSIAVRASSFASSGVIGIIKFKPGLSIADFETEIVSMKEALEDQEDITALTISLFFSGVFIVLSIFHMILFLYYRKNRSNLYYSLFTLFLFLIFFGIYSTMSGADLQTTKTILLIELLSFFLVPLFFIGLLYEIFYKRLLKMFWILTGALVASMICMFIIGSEALGSIFLVLFLFGGMIETIRIFIRAWIKKREGIRIFIFGFFFTLLVVIAISIISWLLEKSCYKK
jgi:hypothetical protein